MGVDPKEYLPTKPGLAKVSIDTADRLGVNPHAQQFFRDKPAEFDPRPRLIAP